MTNLNLLTRAGKGVAVTDSDDVVTELNKAPFSSTMLPHGEDGRRHLGVRGKEEAGLAFTPCCCCCFLTAAC